jgi:hypothetical protein
VTTALWEALPCGADPEKLVEYAAEGADAPGGSHQAGCAYCQVALREFAELWLPVRRWSERDITVPRRFVATVMSRVRRIVGSPRHAVSTSGRGATMVTSWVLGLMAATATDGTPGVTATAARPASLGRQAVVRCGADGVDIDELDGGAISVSVAVTAGPVNAWPVATLADLADPVRHNVMAAIADHTQSKVATVDVNIDGLDLSPQ